MPYYQEASDQFVEWFEDWLMTMRGVVDVVMMMMMKKDLETVES